MPEKYGKGSQDGIIEVIFSGITGKAWGFYPKYSPIQIVDRGCKTQLHLLHHASLFEVLLFYPDYQNLDLELLTTTYRSEAMVGEC